MNHLLLAVDEVVTAAAEQPGPSSSGWPVFLGIIAVIFVPFLLGNVIANALRLRDYGTRIGLVLFTIVLAIGPFVIHLAQGNQLKDALSWGIDLAGGTNMVFQVDRDAASAEGKEITSEVMTKMEAAVRRRVNPTGTEEVSVRTVGQDRLEVIVPGADQEKVERIKRQIVDLGELEFALLADQVEHAQIVELARTQPEDQLNVYRSDRLVGMWRRPAIDANGDPKVDSSERVTTRTRLIDGQPVTEFLLVVDPDPNQRIQGRLLKNVNEQITERGLAVGFAFNERGSYLFQKLTSRYQPHPGSGFKHRLAVLLNDEIHSAPSIESVIPGTGVIQGSFTQAEIDDLVGVLNAGALEVPLVKKPVSEFTVSPLLGEDIQRRGLTSLAVSMVAVFAVTISFYLVAGLVADICLFLNAILALGVMAMIDATFTLPGMAGFVLSVAMAVDANILIFERIREERARGSSLRMAIKNGFDKAFTTIFDSNVTTLIVAVILYYFGTDQVKGFAVTLFIGVAVSMYTAVFVARLIFDIAEQKRWITDLKMFRLFGKTNIDFLGKRGLFYGLSLAAIAIGLVVVGFRGQDNLDIDFRGGSMVTFKFVGDEPTTDEVREALQPKFEESLSIEPLRTQQGDALYRIRTIEPDATAVSNAIRDAFAETPYQLAQQSLSIGEITKIAEADGSSLTPDPYAGGHEVIVTSTETVSASGLADEANFLLLNEKTYETTSQIVDGIVETSLPETDHPVKLRFASIVPEEDVQALLANLKTTIEARPHFEELNTFEPAVAGDAQRSALLAIFCSFVAVVAYLWVRFQNVTFGLAACIGLLHDVLVVLGLVAIGAYFSGNPIGRLLLLEDFKINLTVVASFMTIIGYSLNDTIVVFDRIREVRGRNPALTYEMVNQSLNETLARTLLTSVTTLIVLFILYIMGGEGVHAFSYCLILGIIVGTYSTIYIASPILVWLTNRQAKTVTAPAATTSLTT